MTVRDCFEDLLENLLNLLFAEWSFLKFGEQIASFEIAE
jgi:hypothetical protein